MTVLFFLSVFTSVSAACGAFYYKDKEGYTLPNCFLHRQVPTRKYADLPAFPKQGVFERVG